MVFSSEPQSVAVSTLPILTELPRLSVALRRLSNLSGPHGINAASKCYTLEQKRALLAGSLWKDQKALKLSSLFGRLEALLPHDTTLHDKKTLGDLFDSYSSSCLDLVGRNTTDAGDLSAIAVLLCFGRLGPILVNLIEHGVSVEDLPRHRSTQRERPSILSTLGGTGSEHVDDSWKSVCVSLGSLLSATCLHSFQEQISALMRQCRVAVESDSPHLVLPSDLKSQAAKPSLENMLCKLDWDGAERSRELLRHKSAKLSRLLFGSRFNATEQFENGSTTIPPSQLVESAATDTFRQMLCQPLTAAATMRLSGTVDTGDKETSVAAVDLSLLFDQLAPKANQLHLPVDQLMEMLFEFLRSDRPDEEIQVDLCDLVGWDYVDLVCVLLRYRSAWVSVYERRNDMENFVETVQKKTDSTQSNAVEPDQPSLVDRLLLDPATLAAARNEQREANARATADRLREVMLSGPSAATQAVAYRKTYPNVYDLSADLRDTMAGFDGAKVQLPIGTVFQQLPLWDQVQFPTPLNPPSAVIDVPRIQIVSLDSLGKQVFDGMKELNLIQSLVYPTAYHTAENLLVSAPTGAGKTNVALLAVVQLLRAHLSDDGILDLKAFKIVYLAPMKALAAEMATTFSKRLAPLGVKVRECTGDMQLTKQEILETQMLISTPEKWDVISRKGSGDATLVKLVKLLIIDEIHLLHEERGSVIEVLVARTLRQVETSQTMIRLVGLSATLPNYDDVAHFLHVNPFRGLFYFDSRFRPVPLRMCFVGVRGPNRRVQDTNMNQACYELVHEQVSHGEQVMVFVHARGDTFRTARTLLETARQLNQADHFKALHSNSRDHSLVLKRIERSSDMALRELLPDGFACHHAGMLRADRTLVERLFSDGHIRVLVCTATLAWGVNLPAHAVIIKGTRVYKAEKSDFDDLDILDVLQIFGRAGRPQFDTLGVASIITSKDKLDHYLRLITNQHPIESTLLKNLHDHLNAEIALGTVSSIDDAVLWLKDTYLFVRLMKNPMHYGISLDSDEVESSMSDYLSRALSASATALDAAEMIRYEPATGQLASTDRGRTASLFYIRYSTAVMVKDSLEPAMLLPQLFAILSDASEFSGMKVRDEEGGELNDLQKVICRVPIQKSGSVDTDVAGKVNALLQSYISRHTTSSHSLTSDMNYIHQNAGRLVRYLFELTLRQGWSNCAFTALQLACMIEQRQWDGQSPLWQFMSPSTSVRLLQRVDELELSVDRIRETPVDELAHLIHYRGRDGARDVSQLAWLIPRIQLSVETQPITRAILRVHVKLEADFQWSDRLHGVQQGYWLWIEDPDQGFIYHSEYWTLTKRMVKSNEPISVTCTIPLFEPFPSQYLVRVISDKYLGAESVHPLSFKRLLLPPPDPPHTDLLNIAPLSVCALGNPQYEMLYKFTHFNPIQTQIFHTLYHQDVNVLLGAPTGSGKTVAAELAIFRVFNETPLKKCVYIAPMKALVRERIEDWSVRIGQKLGKRVVELTGDVTPDIGCLQRADLIVTTPEKWDGISRSWQQRSYVRHIALIVIDEIHLLGEERGPVLEVLVSRANYIANESDKAVRIVGLSTALSNAPDLASWLRVPTTMTTIAELSAASQLGPGLIGRGLFNFRPSVRPVPLETHIQGYPGRHYCPRMATMNKPIYLAVNSHSPTKPVLVFVSSRRQTRLTALDLVSYIAASGDSKKWLHMDPDEMDAVVARVEDVNLRLTLAFGIGLHHAGLQSRDRSLVEELFVNQKIQILIATSTLAWGVNFPAHLVVVKGTEYYDGQTKRYVDYPITDVLQMMGRAGRPQFDDQGKAVIMVQDSKKAFYKRFLYEPFPVESCLLKVLPDHLNAEVVAGTIRTTQEALDYLTWTFFFRRLLANPSYYGLEDCEPASVCAFLSGVILNACNQLVDSACLQFATNPEQPMNDALVGTEFGRLASYYYLSHKTMRLFTERLQPDLSVHQLLEILANAQEFALLPVRHNEDQMNEQLATMLPLKPIGMFECPHTKTHLLLQAHFSRLGELPVADYLTDTRSVLDQVTRILQAMLDACAQCGWLVSCINSLLLMQMITQGLWIEDVGSSLLQLPGLHPNHLDALSLPDGSYIACLPELIDQVNPHMERLDAMLATRLRPNALTTLKQLASSAPLIKDRARESWVLLLANTDSSRIGGGGSELLAMKRVPPTSITRASGHNRSPQSSGGHAVNVAFRLPEPPRSAISTNQSRTEHDLTLYLICDAYLGLDQQISLRFNIIPSPLRLEEERKDGDFLLDL